MAASRGSTGQTAALAAVGLAAWCVWELTRQDVEHFDAPEDGGVLFDRDELVNEEEEPEEEEPGEEEPGEEEPEEEEPGGQTALAPVIVSDANVSRSGTNSGVSTGSVYRGKDLNFSCPGGYVVAQRPRGMPACNPAQQWRDTGFSLTADGPVLGMQECVRCVGNTFALVAGAPINTTPLPLATTTPLPLATMTPLPLATTTPLPLPVLFFHPPVAQQAPAPPSAFFAQLRPIVPTQPPTRPPGPIRTPGPAPSFRTRPNTLRPAALKKPVQVLPMKPAVLKPVIPPPPPNKKPLTGRPRPAPVSRPAPPQPKPQPPQPAGPAPGMTLLTPGSKALNAKGSRLASVVTKSGKQAYEVTYKKGVRGPKGSTGGFNIEPSAFFPAEQVRFRFKIWFDDSFPWGPEMKKVGGKIIGLKIGTGDSSGGNYSATGASYRLTWSLNGGVGPYLYPQVRGSYSKGGHGEQLGPTPC